MGKYTFQKGEKLFDITGSVKDSDGTAYNLAGATIKFKMVDINDINGTLKIDGNAVIVDAPLGLWKYTVQATDFNTAGTYYQQLVITIGTLIVKTQKNTIVIEDDVGL